MAKNKSTHISSSSDNPAENPLPPASAETLNNSEIKEIEQSLSESEFTDGVGSLQGVDFEEGTLKDENGNFLANSIRPDSDNSAENPPTKKTDAPRAMTLRGKKLFEKLKTRKAV